MEEAELSHRAKSRLLWAVRDSTVTALVGDPEKVHSAPSSDGLAARRRSRTASLSSPFSLGCFSKN